MKIYIVRHGSAEAGAVQDQGRGLTGRGLQQAAGAGRWLADQVGGTDVRLLSSPYKRAAQTADAIARACGLTAETDAGLIPDADVTELAASFTASAQDFILVSHLPLVGRLAALLVDGQVHDQPWSPAEVWCLEGDIAAAGCMSVAGVWYPVLDGI
ncbi:MAG: phosphohistidine phosphatase SixA [Pseudomonadota bacterium]|nr:phosphohistidine phosphatase SixA [Pseudomonadota bacterium]